MWPVTFYNFVRFYHLDPTRGISVCLRSALVKKISSRKMGGVIVVNLVLKTNRQQTNILTNNQSQMKKEIKPKHFGLCIWKFSFCILHARLKKIRVNTYRNITFIYHFLEYFVQYVLIIFTSYNSSYIQLSLLYCCEAVFLKIKNMPP